MYRYENKYTINKYEDIELRSRLSPIMKLDKFVLKDNCYKVRSMYFDDYNNTCFKDVLNGVSRRVKYRIRLYNYDDNYIVLEKKEKLNNMTRKDSCKISKKQVEDILSDNIRIDDKNPKLLNELYILIKTKRYRPVVVIDYDRIPYVYDNLVRVTIDSNITCSYNIDSFFNKRKLDFHVTDDNTSILEVKYTSILPDVVKYCLQVNSLYQSPYSKYLNSRLIIKDYVGGRL